jgi:hypothetical protein
MVAAMTISASSFSLNQSYLNPLASLTSSGVSSSDKKKSASSSSFQAAASSAPSTVAQQSSGILTPPIGSQTFSALLNASQNNAANNQLASAPADSSSTDYLADGEDNLPQAAKDFLKYQSMSPQEKMEDSILKSMGLTEDQLKAMPPDQQAKIMDEITAKIKQKMEQEMQDKASGSAAASPTADAVAAS